MPHTAETAQATGGLLGPGSCCSTQHTAGVRWRLTDCQGAQPCSQDSSRSRGGAAAVVIQVQGVPGCPPCQIQPCYACVVQPSSGAAKRCACVVQPNCAACVVQSSSGAAKRCACDVQQWCCLRGFTNRWCSQVVLQTHVAAKRSYKQVVQPSGAAKFGCEACDAHVPPSLLIMQGLHQCNNEWAYCLHKAFPPQARFTQ